MSNYLEYLDKNYSKKTFFRKVDYIKYNFGKKVNHKKSGGIKVLEIGPGMGEFIKYLNDRGCDEIDIVDNDKSILQYIENNFKIRQTFLVNNILDIEGRLSMYDVIVATQVLEHIPVSEQLKFIGFLYKHLSPDGNIIITVPNMANPFTLYERYGDTTHETGFTDNSLKQICLNCSIPLSNIEIRGFQIPPYSILNLIRIFFQKMLHGTILLLSIINAGGYSKSLTPNITLVIKK